VPPNCQNGNYLKFKCKQRIIRSCKIGLTVSTSCACTGDTIKHRSWMPKSAHSGKPIKLGVSFENTQVEETARTKKWRRRDRYDFQSDNLYYSIR
jgi:hypothetical protein